MRPRIFISHSAHEPDAQGLLEDLADGLVDAGFDVLLDRARLMPGSRWRQEIYTWMGLCHAAVVLFSPSALRPESWVSTEVTILNWRRALDPDLLLVPVLLPQVTRRKLERGAFGRIAINEIHASPNDPDALVANLVGRFSSLLQACPTPRLEGWIRIIAEAVADAERRNPGLLEEAAARTGKQLAGWEPGVPAQERLAREILHWEPEAIRIAVEFLCYSIKERPLKRMIDILGCLWVDPRAVSGIPGLAYGPEPERIVALNASREWTAEMYVRRAACCVPPWDVVIAADHSGEGQAARISLEISEALKVLFGLDHEDYNSPAEINRFLREKLRRPVVVLLDAVGLDLEVLENVRAEWPVLILLLLTGDRVYERAMVTAAPTKVLVLPDLDRSVEKDAWENYRILAHCLKDAIS